MLKYLIYSQTLSQKETSSLTVPTHQGSSNSSSLRLSYGSFASRLISLFPLQILSPPSRTGVLPHSYYPHRSLNLPFRLKWYHALCWSCALGMALVLTFGKDLHGFWFVDAKVDKTAICWIKSSSQEDGKINYRTWVFLYIPLIIVYVYCIRVMVGAYAHLRNGISKTFQHRVRVLVMNSINITIYMMYWAVLGFFYALSYGFSGGNPSLARWSWRVVMFIISSKGFADLLVFILVSDSDFFTGGKTGSSDTLDVNGALRQEVLHYATTGIRECAARRSDTESKRKLVLLMTQKNVPLSNILTLQHLVMLVFKGENIKMDAAPEGEVDMQLETEMHHVEDDLERPSESNVRQTSGRSKRRSTLTRKVEMPQGYREEESPTSSPLSGGALDVERDVSIESHHIGREFSTASTLNLSFATWTSPFKQRSSGTVRATYLSLFPHIFLSLCSLCY
jgi:hypothetical protein